MPVTPGGSVDNWAARSKIAGMPIWLFNGLKDNEYTTNSTRVMDLETTAGGSPFFKYTYAFPDEYKDIVPVQALTEKHVFGSYENIGHDVWHAAYGVYCPTLTSTKTTQFKWLLSQSRNGSAFIDPRGGSGGTGGSAGAGGVAGNGGASGGAGASGSSGTAGSAGSGGDAASGGAAGSAGGAVIPSAGSSGSTTSALPVVNSGENAPGCQCSAVGGAHSGTGGAAALAVLAIAAAFGTRRRRSSMG